MLRLQHKTQRGGRDCATGNTEVTWVKSIVGAQVTLNDDVCSDPQESRLAHPFASSLFACPPQLACCKQGRQRVGLPLTLSAAEGFASYLRLTGKRRLELAGGEVIQRAEPAAEFVVAQAVLAVERSKKLLG